MEEGVEVETREGRKMTGIKTHTRAVLRSVERNRLRNDVVGLRLFFNGFSLLEKVHHPPESGHEDPGGRCRQASRRSGE